MGKKFKLIPKIVTNRRNRMDEIDSMYESAMKAFAEEHDWFLHTDRAIALFEHFAEFDDTKPIPEETMQIIKKVSSDEANNYRKHHPFCSRKYSLAIGKRLFGMILTSVKADWKLAVSKCEFE